MGPWVCAGMIGFRGRQAIEKALKVAFVLAGVELPQRARLGADGTSCGGHSPEAWLAALSRTRGLCSEDQKRGDDEQIGSRRLLYLSLGKFGKLEMTGSSIDRAASTNQSPLKGALLALLVQGPSYGYELANRLERQLGPSWPILRPSLYRMLKKLQAEGLLSSEPSKETSSARIVYGATDMAEPALVAWMDSPLPHEQGQLQLQARMIVARQEDLPRLLVALDCHERALFVKRAEIEAGVPARQSLRAAMMYLVREASIQQINGELLWVDMSRQTIRALLGS